MIKEYHSIYVPGLNDQHVLNRNLSRYISMIWRFYGIKVHILMPHWEQGSHFAPKLQEIIEKIDELNSQNHRISLIGQSAGGSAVLNAFSEKRNLIDKVINVAGRLKQGDCLHPSLEWASRKSPAFAESVLLFEKINEPLLSETDRRKIMTIRPFWDEIVPSSTVEVVGAKNLVVPFFEHSFGGFMINCLYSKTLFDFISNSSEI